MTSSLPPAPRSSAPLLIAVDGGATGTRVRVADAAGQRLGEGHAGPSSLSLGVAAAWTNIGVALDLALADAGLAPSALADARVGCALAGSRNAGRRAAFFDSNPLGLPTLLMTDGYASLIGALGGQPGTVLAVGTGVAAHRLHSDHTTSECSGWGFPQGDEGGGAWIGLHAARAVLRHYDGRDTRPSLLHGALTAVMGHTVAALQDWLVGAPSTKLAQLAPLVLAAAAEQDAVALQILHAAGAELALCAQALDGGDPTVPVALVGGLAAALLPYLPADLTSRIVPAQGAALDGVLLVLAGRAPEESHHGA
jgi:glucosamine kinase